MSAHSLIREFKVRGNRITLMQDDALSDSETAATVWDASLVLAKYFENSEDFPENFFKGKKVLELGAGCGLIGMSLALLGAEVTATDQKKVLPVLERNIAANTKDRPLNIRTAELEWGTDVAHLNGPFDLVVASDVVYLDAQTEMLVNTIDATVRSGGLVLFSNEKRDSAIEGRFLRLMISRSFKISNVSSEKLHKKYRGDGFWVIRMTKS